jgi:predicted ATPase
MIKDTQLSLFQLTSRDSGKEHVNSTKGGLLELQVKNFKGIENVTTKFDPITLLVGANNSGKSTILQAIRLFFYCVQKCGVSYSDDSVLLKKQVMPFSSFGLIPAHDIRELVINGITPSEKKRGIYLSGKLNSGRRFDFTIYSAYSTLLVILPGDLSPNKLSKKEYDIVSRQPLYVPGFFGVVTKEYLTTNQRVEELLGSGHHNEVLRNLILRLGPDNLKSLSSLLGSEFPISFQGVNDDPNIAEFLKAAYRESALRIPLDIISAGSGFLQVLQILTHALQSPSPILLLDEPDAHMHIQLQEHFISLLRSFSSTHNMQIIMASHSETFLRTMELSEIRLVDRKTNRSDVFSDPIIMKADLNNLGIWPNEHELTEALRIKKVLLCESEPDSKLLSCLASNLNPEWDKVEKQYQVITTQGTNDNVVVRMQAVVGILNILLNGNVRVAYLRDRDLMCDEKKENAERESKILNLDLVITNRRNRESYLVEPLVVEAAVLSLSENVPYDWTAEGAISKLVHDWCLDFCHLQLDELPVKVKEYNQQWLRTEFDDESDRRDAETRLQTFVRENWNDKIQAKEIPWKLMDGKGALKFIRQKFQEKSLILTDSLLLKYSNVVNIPPEFMKLIKIIKSWN